MKDCLLLVLYHAEHNCYYEGIFLNCCFLLFQGYLSRGDVFDEDDTGTACLLIITVLNVISCFICSIEHMSTEGAITIKNTPKYLNLPSSSYSGSNEVNWFLVVIFSFCYLICVSLKT